MLSVVFHALSSSVDPTSAMYSPAAALVEFTSYGTRNVTAMVGAAVQDATDEVLMLVAVNGAVAMIPSKAFT